MTLKITPSGFTLADEFGNNINEASYCIEHVCGSNIKEVLKMAIDTALEYETVLHIEISKECYND